MNSQPIAPEHRVRLVQNIIRHRKKYFVVTAFKVEQRVDRKREKAARLVADSPDPEGHVENRVV